MPSTVAAAVDIGSTSVHLLVARVDGHALEPLADDSILLELGARIDATGRLGSDGRAELVAALASDAGRARALGAASIVFVGTEPLRRAADAGRIVGEVEGASDVPLHVLTHEEEAYLTLIGVTSGQQVRVPLAVIDIGGGSTEIVSAGPGAPVEATGVRIGAGRLAAEFLHSDPPGPGEIVELRTAAHRWIEGVPALTARTLVAVGGTASNLLRVLPSVAEDRTLTRERLAEAMEVLVSEPSVDLAERRGLRETRARLLPAGAAILEALLDRCAVDEIRVSEAGIREGAVLVVAHAGIAWRDRLPLLASGWDD